MILFAVRERAGTFAPAGVPELPMTGLHRESAAALLDDLGASLSGALERLISETHGNPLALRELPPLIATPGAHLGAQLILSPPTAAYHPYKVSGTSR